MRSENDAFISEKPIEGLEAYLRPFVRLARNQREEHRCSEEWTAPNHDRPAKTHQVSVFDPGAARTSSLSEVSGSSLARPGSKGWEA